jgi:hypothetical protein
MERSGLRNACSLSPLLPRTHSFKLATVDEPSVGSPGPARLPKARLSGFVPLFHRCAVCPLAPCASMHVKHTVASTVSDLTFPSRIPPQSSDKPHAETAQWSE